MGEEAAQYHLRSICGSHVQPLAWLLPALEFKFAGSIVKKDQNFTLSSPACHENVADSHADTLHGWQACLQGVKGTNLAS